MGPPYLVKAARALAIRSAPTSFGLSYRMRTLVRTPGPTMTGSHFRYRREASTRAGLMVGTTLEITTPSTTPRSIARRSKSWRSSTAISSAVRSRCDVTRQSATRRSPSNRASVTLVLPTSTARSMGSRTLLRQRAVAAPAPGPPAGRLPLEGTGPLRHPPGLGSPHQVAPGQRSRGAPRRREGALPHLPADRVVRLAEGLAGPDQLFRGVGRRQTGIGGGRRQALAVELEVSHHQLRRLS